VFKCCIICLNYMEWQCGRPFIGERETANDVRALHKKTEKNAVYKKTISCINA
jgi:hypothetical protein